MSTPLTCPGCEKIFAAVEHAPGTRIRCGRCGETITVGVPGAEPAVVEPLPGGVPPPGALQKEPLPVVVVPIDVRPASARAPEPAGSWFPLVAVGAGLLALLFIAALGVAGAGFLFWARAAAPSTAAQV